MAAVSLLDASSHVVVSTLSDQRRHLCELLSHCLGLLPRPHLSLVSGETPPLWHPGVLERSLTEEWLGLLVKQQLVTTQPCFPGSIHTLLRDGSGIDGGSASHYICATRLCQISFAYGDFSFPSWRPSCNLASPLSAHQTC